MYLLGLADMRHRYIISYDVSDARRLSRVHKKMRGYGDPLQYSVFRCDLSDAEKIILQAHLHELIHHGEDRIMIVRLGPAARDPSEDFEFMGKVVPMAILKATIV